LCYLAGMCRNSNIVQK